MVGKQLCLYLDKGSALSMRLAYGVVSSIKVTDRLDTGSPFCAQVILRLPYRFGASDHELQNRWVYCRVDAFASCAFLPRSAQAVRVGMPVCGLIDKSSRVYETAQLVGLPTTTAQDWKLFSPNTFPFMGIELSSHDIYRLPSLRQRHFPHPAEPPALDYTLALQPDSLHVGTHHHVRTIPLPTSAPPSFPAPKRPPPMLVAPPKPTEAYHPPPDDVVWFKLIFSSLFDPDLSFLALSLTSLGPPFKGGKLPSSLTTTFSRSDARKRRWRKDLSKPPLFSCQHFYS